MNKPIYCKKIQRCQDPENPLPFLKPIMGGMKIDEAIRLLQGDIDYPGSVDIMDVNKAEQLGIEALKRINWLRQVNSQIGASKLAGETE